MRGRNRAWEVSQYTASIEGEASSFFRLNFTQICSITDRELRRMNDECADKIADNRFSIDNSRDWLVTEGGVIDRVHRMSAKTVSSPIFKNKIRF